MNDNQVTTKVGTETATASESTKKLLSAVKRVAKTIDMDADELNDELNSVMVDRDIWHVYDSSTGSTLEGSPSGDLRQASLESVEGHVLGYRSTDGTWILVQPDARPTGVDEEEARDVAVATLSHEVDEHPGVGKETTAEECERRIEWEIEAE